jgi:3-phenylpropionate/trans-cinnamate dioxygenase ferredoxin reductase subunit
MIDDGSIVIVGGGHAGARLCAALADGGQGKRVHLVCEEQELPYQRPPLSKSYLKDCDERLQLQRNESWFEEAGITLHRGDPATALDRKRRVVELRSGRVLSYGGLVLATGAYARRLPDLPRSLANVEVLRTFADAQRLREALDRLRHLTVLGGGFMGLEVAATARALGKSVTILEAAPRLLTRSASPELAEHVLQTHRASGIEIRLAVRVGGFETERDRVIAMKVDGRREPVERLFLGIGVAPETSLAREAGLICNDGISVDGRLRTSDPAILAIGDCASFPDPAGGCHLRLESVQNANDQARCAAATLAGCEEPYHATPWFWSEQASLRLQMTGLIPPDGTRYRREGAKPTSFSILHYVGRRLVCVESANASIDHRGARKLLEAGRSPEPAQACDPTRPIESCL